LKSMYLQWLYILCPLATITESEVVWVILHFNSLVEASFKEAVSAATID